MIILLPVIALPFFKGLELHSFHGDENYWLRSSQYFKILFLDRNLESREWGACKIEPVGKYIIGLALYVAGYEGEIEELSRLKRWKFLKGYKWNVANGRMPSRETLYVARFTMALLGSLTCLLIYWIGRVVWSGNAGIIASLLLAYNPLMLLCCKRAMTDAPVIFFMTANILLMVCFYQSLLKRKALRTVVFAALIGLNSALAAGTKLNGALCVIIFACFCILVIGIKGVNYTFSESAFGKASLRFKGDRELKMIISSLLISGIIALLVFVGTNPCLYKQPFQGALNMVNYRTTNIDYQAKHWGPALDSFEKKFNFVARNTLFPKHYTTLGNIFKIPIDCILFLVGLATLLYTEIKYVFNNAKPSLKSIIIIWTTVTFAAIITWIPLNWPRYYLPVIPCIVIVIGFCLDAIISKGWLFLKQLNPLRSL